jgi:hypothetical protein
VSGLNLATPDARHRRPLKFFLYHLSVKTTLMPKGEIVVQEVSDASPSWRDSGHSKGYLHSLPFPTETAERKSSKKCWNVTDPPIIMVVRKAFFDVGHSLKDQRSNRRSLSEGTPSRHFRRTN